MFPGQTSFPKRPVRFAVLFLLSVLAGFAAAPTNAADDVSEMTNTCTLSGGTATSGGGHFKCCWPGWGCVHCAASDGEILADQCWTDCESQACRDANAGDRLGLPQTKKPPAATAPGSTPGTIAPSQNKKPNKAPDPNAGTVQ